ncbi:hypothetical protein I79_008025 [Cricetulus griseus]|uniref:Uncharacterized protein n=1 Tax=Cricetulus griseus TaxID=10029 RepID=G3HBY9_CRIGR|nr:hypothetical protein I79_008025 [Cricetulus griseus]
MGFWLESPVCLVEEEATESALPNEYPGRTRGAKGINGEESLTCMALPQKQVPERNMPPADTTNMVLQQTRAVPIR